MKLLLIEKPKDIEIIKKKVEYFGPWAQTFETPEELEPPSFVPYPNPDEVYKTNLRTIRSAQSLLDVLAKAVPSIIEVRSYPHRFWHYLYANYAIFMAGFVEDIRTRFEALPEKEYILGRPLNPRTVPPADLNAFKQRSFIPDLRLIIMDECLRPEFSDHKGIMYESDLGVTRELKRKKIHSLLRDSYYFLKGFSSRFVTSFVPVRGIGLGLTRQSFAHDLFYSSSGIYVPSERMFQKDLPSLQVDWKLRERLSEKFPSPYKEIVKRTFPLTDLEGIQDVIETSEENVRRFPRKATRVYVNARAFSGPAPLRATLALLASKELEVISIQHGGAYNYQSHSGVTFIEGVLADSFISWGWKDWEKPDIETKKVTPMPSLYLHRIKKSSVRKKNIWRALLLVFSEDRYPKWIYNPIFSDMAHDYFPRQKVLLNYFNQLAPSAVKLFPYEYGWKQNAWIKEKYKSLEHISKGKFLNYADKARICIVDYSGTGFLELLARSKPFLCTWNRKYFYSIPSFEQALDKLSDTEIFYENPEDLVKQFHSIEDNLEEWWNEPERKKAVADVAREFAYCAEDTKQQWRKEFSRL